MKANEKTGPPETCWSRNWRSFINRKPPPRCAPSPSSSVVRDWVAKSFYARARKEAVAPREGSNAKKKVWAERKNSSNFSSPSHLPARVLSLFAVVVIRHHFHSPTTATWVSTPEGRGICWSLISENSLGTRRRVWAGSWKLDHFRFDEMISPPLLQQTGDFRGHQHREWWWYQNR